MDQQRSRQGTSPFRRVVAALGTGPAEITRAANGTLSVNTVRSIYYRGVTPRADLANTLVQALRKIAMRRALASLAWAEPMQISIEELWPPTLAPGDVLL
jgi:hypothetical protein